MGLQRKINIKLQQLRFYSYLRDGYNRIMHGPYSPLYAERLWIDPRDVIAVEHDHVMNLGWGYYSSGKIVPYWPFDRDDYISVLELPKISQMYKTLQ